MYQSFYLLYWKFWSFEEYIDLEVGLWYSVAENEIQNFRVLSQKTFSCSIWHYPPVLGSNQQSQYSFVQDNCAVLRLLLRTHWRCRNENKMFTTLDNIWKNTIMCLRPHKKGQWALHVYNIANFVVSWL